MSLADAQRELEENPPPSLNLTDHPVALRALGEFLDEREQQGEAADPAA